MRNYKTGQTYDRRHNLAYAAHRIRVSFVAMLLGGALIGLAIVACSVNQ